MILKEKWNDLWLLSLRPALRRMFGKRRWGNTLLLIGTFYLIASMLSVICLSYHVNLRENDRLAADYETYISSSAAATDTESAQAAAAALRHILISKIELTSVFVFLMVVWGILSAFALARVFHATVEQDKYIYGLYVTFGSDTRQIRRQIHTEFLLAAHLALVLALPTATACTAAVYLKNGQRFLPGGAPYFQILLWLFAVSLIGAGYLSRRITKSSCVELMAALDCSDYVSSPRVSRLFGKRLYNGSLRYARLAILRMRGYYVPLILTVSVVASVFFASMNLALEGERSAAESIHEYSIEFSRGVSGKDIQKGYIDHLLTVEDVDTVEATAHESAERMGTHLLVESAHFDPNGDTVPVDFGTYCATDDIHLICADSNTLTELGGKNILPDPWEDVLYLHEKAFNYSMIPPAGETVYLYPAGSEPDLLVSEGDTLQLALPRGGAGRSLSEKVEDGMYEYLSVTVSKIIAVPDVYYVTLFDAVHIGPRISEQYLLLNPEDYATVTRDETVEALSLDELYREDLRFGELKAPAVLLVPEGWEGKELTTLQMYAPLSQIKAPYSVSDPLDSNRSITLSDEEFFQNRTAFSTYFYFGTAGDMNNDASALEQMMQIDATSLSKYEVTELTVTDRIECPGLTAPCILLPNDGFLSSYDGDLCILQLTERNSLWSVSDELLIFGTDASLKLPDYLGRTLFSHTEIEAGFFDAMREQGLYTTYPDEEAYELSAFTVDGMFDLNSATYFVCRLSPNCNLGIDRYPAYMAPGKDFFFLGGPMEDTERPLADTESYLMFSQAYLRPNSRMKTLTEGNFAATTELTVSLADSINADILTPGFCPEIEEAGKAVLVLRPDSPLSLQAGNFVRLAKRGEFALDPNDPHVASLVGNDLLAHLVEEGYDFQHISLSLDDVVVMDVPQDILYVSEPDWQRVRRTDSTYRTLDIYLYGDTDLVSLIRASARIRALMGNWQSTENRVTLIDHNRLWKAVTTGACNYPAIIRLLSVMLILLLPLLWCSPQRMHFHKRQEEFIAMDAVGRTPRQLRRMIAAECLMITLAAGAFVALLCPLSVLCVKAAIYMMELPFETSAFDTGAYLFMILFVMLCSALSFLLCARQITPKKTKKGADIP